MELLRSNFIWNLLVKILCLALFGWNHKFSIFC